MGGGTEYQARGPVFYPWNPCKARRGEPTPHSCPVTLPRRTYYNEYLLHSYTWYIKWTCLVLSCQFGYILCMRGIGCSSAAKHSISVCSWVPPPALWMKSKQERKRDVLTVMCLCVNLTRDQSGELLFVATWHSYSHLIGGNLCWENAFLRLDCR